MKALRTLSIALASLATSAAFAQVSIDQNKAMAGGITPGDTPGFPITLSQPGSYKLTSNLTVPASVAGVVITGNNVTLDLNGFTISGPASCAQVLPSRVVNCVNSSSGSVGVDAGSSKGAVVRNGTIKGAGAGVVVGGLGRYENLRVTENGAGIVEGSSQSSNGNTLSNCLVDTNGYNGVTITYGQIERCRIVSNGGAGVATDSYALTISESQLMENRGYGIYGGAARATITASNGAGNRKSVISMGGNLDQNTPF